MPRTDGTARTRANSVTRQLDTLLPIFEPAANLASAHPSDFQVAPVAYLDALQFVARHHYSGGMSAGPITFGLYHRYALIGVCAFATPIGETVRAQVFGPEHVDRVTELHRLVLLDAAPGNSESWFIVRALRALKVSRPHTWGVLSYADSTQNHRGVIYQATNALYTGTAPNRTQYVDTDGRIRPHRQDGVEISRSQACAWGWTTTRQGPKYRYLFLTPDNRAHRRELVRRCLLTSLPYPKASAA